MDKKNPTDGNIMSKTIMLVTGQFAGSLARTDVVLAEAAAAAALKHPRKTM